MSTLSETSLYQSILDAMLKLNRSVTQNPSEFASTQLKEIDSLLWDLVEAVEEGSL